MKNKGIIKEMKELDEKSAEILERRIV